MSNLVRVDLAAANQHAPRAASSPAAGWRAGRPVEDPDKMKRWGFITAKPSEFLVHVRRGQVRESSSGQGASCFKWPRDAVAVVPTSLQRLQFHADQVTLEKVGVEVTGFAVYRIADPVLAFRVLNFSYPERAQEKLEETLTSMFIGATRRLVANLSVDDCLQKRKSALAQELLVEIAPVVGGRGRPSDTTARGWGVVLDTIEIQEVRVLSENVFASMQAPFRARLNQNAHLAETTANEVMAERESEHQRKIEEARIANEMVVREKRVELAAAEAESRRQGALRDAQIDQQIERARLETESAARKTELELALDEQRGRTESHVEEQRLAQQRADADLQTARLLIESQGAQQQLARAQWEHERALRADRADLEHQEGHLRAVVALDEARAANEAAAARARVLTAENLPQLAAAMGERMGEVRITQFGTDNPFGSIAQGISAVLEMAKQVKDL